MKVRSVTFAFVSSVFFAALGATSSSVFASSPSINPLTTQAYSALANGDNGRAITIYSQAIEARDLAPEMLANALLNRALAYQQQNKQALAIDDYTAALSLDAMSTELRATALYNRGLSQQKTSNDTMAIEDFTSALLLNPTFAHAFYGRGNALRDSGQFLFALSDFDRALKYNHPDPARVYYAQAQTFELLQRPIDARRALEAALSANPDYTLAKEKLAQLESSVPAQADVAYVETDPILTGSVAAVGGNTLVRKPDLPVGIEPPANLMAGNTSEITDANAQPSAKLFTDRVPESAAVAELLPAKAKPETIIMVASVPQIPPAKKIAPVPDDFVTAAIDPAPPAEEKLSGWNIQVASAVSESAAWSSWKKMQKKFTVLSTEKASVVKADLGSKGIYYRVKLTGYASQADAASSCSKLKGKGVACFISKVN